MHPDFFQQGPELTNQYATDGLLRSMLAWKMPSDILNSVQDDLTRFGERAATELLPMAADALQNPPRHVPYDPWGRRIDVIETSAGWQNLHRVAAEEGLVAIGYERKQGEYSRVYQLAKLYLYHPSSAFYSCPLAMTDGAARVLELTGESFFKERAVKNLTSRDPKRFWTSGQWMTEKTGGSDVSQTQTTAVRDGQGFRLYGIKWFCSATTADMTLALARIQGAESGSRGLSLFYLEIRDDQGELNHLQVNRLKDKLGTRALPTAELSLNGAWARLVGEEGKGVKAVASMLNVTRVYNSVCAVGQMRRNLVLVRDYASKRQVLSKSLLQHPLHVETLTHLQSEVATGLILTLHVAHLLGRDETGAATSDEKVLLRLLVPIVKLQTGKQAVATASEVLEGFGGVGYIEDSGFPLLLRDSQVFPIWEGTTNVLSLDVLRVLNREPEALKIFTDEMKRRLTAVRQTSALAGLATQTEEHLQLFLSWVQKLARSENETFEASARTLAMTLGRLFTLALLLEWAQHSQKAEALQVCERQLRGLNFQNFIFDQTHRQNSKALLEL